MSMLPDPASVELPLPSLDPAIGCWPRTTHAQLQTQYKASCSLETALIMLTRVPLIQFVDYKACMGIPGPAIGRDAV